MKRSDDDIVRSANLFCSSKGTIRSVAADVDIPRSTLYNLFKKRLPRINSELARDVDSQLAANKADRARRGGEATRRRYLNKR